VKKRLVSILCASALAGGASMAYAGAYGEAEKPEEMPAAAPAPAVAPAEVPPPGYWYVGVGGLFSIENFHCDADNAWGYNVRAGRRINDMFAVEAEWEHPVSDYDDADKADGFNNLNGDIEAWDVTLNARLYPVKGRVQPFAQVGGGYGQANLPHDDNGGLVARFGVGLDFLFTDNFGMETGVDYLLGTGSMSDYDQIPISVGIFYNFI